MLPATQLSEFLHAARSAFFSKLTASGTAANIVLGNEGGDLDSVVGSIFLAYFLASVRKQPHIPVLNFPRVDLPLRTEVTFVLRQFHITEDLLLFAAPSNSPKDAQDAVLMADGTHKYVLFDHNKLCDRQRAFGAWVGGIVDHHSDEALYLTQTTDLRLIQPVGSASTLVALMFKNNSEHVPTPLMLLAPILLDTMNLDPATKKATDADREAVAFLLSESCIGDEVNLDETYRILHRAKFDVSRLTLPEVLRRDYKQYSLVNSLLPSGVAQALGISSVLELYETVVARFGDTLLVEEAAKFALSHNCAAEILMFAANDDRGVFTRQLLVVIPRASDPMQDALLRSLRNWIESQSERSSAAGASPGLAIRQERWLKDINCQALFVTQANATFSRKNLSPLIEHWFESQAKL